MEIIRGIYGIPQMGILANKLLAQHSYNIGYNQVKRTSVLWQHLWRPISFTLVVDNIGFGYVGQKHADHIMRALSIYYDKIKTDWKGKLYCGITMKRNCTKRYLYILMPGYIT